MDLNQQMGLTFIVSATLLTLYALTLLGSWIWAAVWRWIDDDTETTYRSPVFTLLMKMWGYKREKLNSYSYQDWSNGKSASDGEMPVALTAVAIFFGPFVVLFSILFYPVALTIFTLYLLARLARYARRHRKAFDKMVEKKDP